MVCLQFVSRHDFAPARPGPQLAALSLITRSEGGVGGGGGVHIRCALTSALAREASQLFGPPRADCRRAETRYSPPPTLTPARLILMLIRPFALKGPALEQFSDLLLFILASSRADSLIDRTQTFTGIRKMQCLDPFSTLPAK